MVLALRSWRQEDQSFESILNYIGDCCQPGKERKKASDIVILRIK